MQVTCTKIQSTHKFKIKIQIKKNHNNKITHEEKSRENQPCNMHKNKKKRINKIFF